MKIKKRVISLILVVLMVCNYIPQGLASRGDELIISDDILDSITDITYGWTGGTYQFPDSVLSGVEEGDEVHLAADIAAAEPIQAGKKVTLELTNFRFEGANVEDYLLPELVSIMTKDVQVLPKKLVVRPAVTGIYYGQDIPRDNMLTELADYSDQLVGEDEVKISAQFEIALEGMEIGTYEVQQVGRLDVKGKDADNYEVEVESGLTFSIEAYEPSVDASSDGVDGAHNGKNTATLTAPKGFLISTVGSMEDDGWDTAITVELEETLAGSFAYYLRNNDRGSEFYRAIVGKTYSYSSIQNMPEVNGIEITAVDPNAILKFEEHAVLTNGSVQVSVYVTGATIAQDMQIILLRNDEEDTVISVPAADAVLEGEKYTYKAVFELPAVDGESFSYQLSAYAVTSAGAGERYPAKNSEDHFLNSETSVNKPLIIDQMDPVVRINDITTSYRNRSIIGDFYVADIHSGIVLVEYVWDSGEYQPFDRYDSKVTDYELVLPWQKAQPVPYGRHTLRLRVTDALGNQTECSLKAGENNGFDYKDPIIDSVAVKPVDEGTAWTNDANGLRANGTVQIIVNVHDDDSDTNSWTSGVDSVTVTANNGTYTAKANDRGANGEYILHITPDKKLTDISITVKDKFGNSTTKDLMTVSGLLSADLYVENDGANIELPKLGFQYGNETVVWLGADQLTENPVVMVTDGPAGVSTGLASIVVYEGETEIASKSDIPFGNKADTIELPIKALSDGIHTLRIVAKDNCGNTSERTYSFHKDVAKPESAKITPVQNISEFSNEKWFSPDTDHSSISFRIGANKAEDRLSRITITVNGQERTYSINQGKNLIGSDQYGDCVVIDTKDFTEAFQEENGYNQYVITAKFWDLAGNTFDQDYTIYVDKFHPTIDRVTVQKKNENLVDRILRLLSFGIFSNDALIFRVYASDARHDSGMQGVTVQYAADSAAIDMKWDSENGCYSIDVPTDDIEKFEGTLAFKATDRFGKACTSCPFVQGPNDEETDSFFVMVEKDAPVLSCTSVVGDGFKREDSQVWCNSNKELMVTTQDGASGINNIVLTVNGVEIPADKNGTVLLAAPTQRENGLFSYWFDTDALVQAAGENAEGKYDIAILATDNSGNVKPHNETFYVDKTAPKIDSISFVPATANDISNVTEFVEELKYGYFFKEDFNITVNVSDEEPSSGLYAVNYRLVPYSNVGEKLEETAGSVRIADGKATISVPKGFMGQIFVEANDYVNNSSGEMTTKAYVVDGAAPVISITKNVSTQFKDADGNPLYTASNSFTVVITDQLAGLKEFGYAKTAEQAPHDRKWITVSDNGAQLRADLGDGWIVTGVNANLVTQVTKTFTFATDDNSIAMQFDAIDWANNQAKPVSSETFTIDTIAPIIQVVFREDNDDDLYYNQNRIADITITERNFSANLIKVMIENTFGSVPGYTFTSKSLTEHTATINFDEGDYNFDVTGSDLSGRSASVSFAGGNEKHFFVDKTAPVIQANFASFTNNSENSFNYDKTATITITEHNFDSKLTNLRIYRKAAGAEHSMNGMVDVTDEILGGKQWARNGDTHSISFVFADDAVYYVEIAPVDLASNRGPKRNTVVFEIDKTVPVVSSKNGKPTDETDTEFLDIYDYARKDSENPTVGFADENIAYIEYTLITFIPVEKEEGLIKVEPSVKQGVVEGNLFTLENFELDGIYALELVAVDVAGNRSEKNANTYARMVNQDVLAFILDSNKTEKTGLYSLEHPNGDAISKKPYDFKNLRILVMAPAETDIDIVLRDTDGVEIETDAKSDVNKEHFGIFIHTFTLSAGFFREKFQEDVDKEMHLTVRNRGMRIDLAKVHIDSEEPSCVLPAELDSWKWFRGQERHTFVISNISELLEESECRIYDNGQLIPFVYSSEDDTVTFTLDKGWHNVGVILSDTAGNDYISTEVIAMHIGPFWWYVIALAAAAMVAVVVIPILYKRKREQLEMEAEM